jgi:hypothetical protein
VAVPLVAVRRQRQRRHRARVAGRAPNVVERGANRVVSAGRAVSRPVTPGRRRRGRGRCEEEHGCGHHAGGAFRVPSVRRDQDRVSRCMREARNK